MTEIVERYKVDPALARPQIGYVLAARGDERLKRAFLDTLRRAAEASPERAPAYGVASISAVLGHRTEALEWLEKSYATREGFLTWLGINPDFDSLRNEPQFIDLMRRVGLQP